jgi:hypothetical protein
MGGWRRRFPLLGVVGTAIGIALFLGAADRGAAETHCSGKLLCVTVDSQEKASRSIAATDTTAENAHYLTETVTIANTAASSNLTNLSLTVSWQDIGATAGTTTALRSGFSSSDPAGFTCTGTSSPATCTTPKSLGPGAHVTYTLVFRTAFQATTGTSASSIALTADVAAKEQTNTNKAGKNAFTSAGASTTYEGSPDLDISIGGGGIPNVTLATAQTGQQFSTLGVPADSIRELYQLSEQDYATPVVCASGRNCIGQQVTVNASGLTPVNLQITYAGTIPSGLNENNLAVVHTPDVGPTITVTTKCNDTTLFSGIEPSNIPCRLVDIDRANNIIRVDFWDTSNGQVKIG